MLLVKQKCEIMQRQKMSLLISYLIFYISSWLLFSMASYIFIALPSIATALVVALTILKKSEIKLITVARLYS